MHTMTMTKELADYEITPRIYPVGEQVCVTIRPLGGHVAFTKGEKYLIRIMPLEQNIEPQSIDHFPSILVMEKEGTLCFSWVFQDEQEYFLRIFHAPYQQGQKHICNLRVYALLPDLFARRPYKGDLHIHTHYSDGVQAPAIVAANYRKAGFDFLAITDHHRYAPSLEAIKAYEGHPVDLALFPGEEVHAPDNHTHIVNFGGSISLNDFFKDHPKEYAEQVAAIAENLDLPDGIDRGEAAACHWAFDKIREGGGIAIFPHPHWISSVYHIRDTMSSYLFTSGAFDAFELLGGQEAAPNNKQLAFYHDMRAQGCTVPIVGSSDSHGTVDTVYFAWTSTMVFSPSLELQDLRSSILDLYSVAVETYPNEQPRFYGPYRMVKLAIFLWDTYFVLHDESCFEEGRQMKALVTGDPNAQDMLQAMYGRTQELLRAWYGQ